MHLKMSHEVQQMREVLGRFALAEEHSSQSNRHWSSHNYMSQFLVINLHV